jgi:hypothetical protein
MFLSTKLCSDTLNQIFAAYVLQCIFIIISWFVFSGFKIQEIWQHSSGEEKTTVRIEKTSATAQTTTPKAKEQNINVESSHNKLRTHQSIFEDFLMEFHITQCYFSTTIQIAALTYRIFSTNMLVTFMPIPLATNGVLPVVFTLVLLYKRNERLSYEVILLTIVCWILSSLVYCILYWHVIPINGDLMTTDSMFPSRRRHANGAIVHRDVSEHDGPLGLGLRTGCRDYHLGSSADRIRVSRGRTFC